MKILLDDNEIMDLAYNELDHANPYAYADNIQALAAQMGMVWDPESDLFEDVEHVTLRHAKRNAIKFIYHTGSSIKTDLKF